MYEGISISELLKKLKVTKQSLNRVLKDLIKLEIIEFKKETDTGAVSNPTAQVKMTKDITLGFINNNKYFE